MSNAEGNWLEDVIVVNERNDLHRVGDVSIFRSASTACPYLEPWWVAGHEGFALDGLGRQVVLAVHDERVLVDRVSSVADGPAILHSWLSATASAIFQARLVRAKKGKLRLGASEAQHVLPRSIEGLIAYIGFRD